MNCPVHDKWKFDKDCNCSAERKWCRSKMLQEALEKIAATKPPKGTYFAIYKGF